MESINQDKNSVTKIKNTTGCFVDVNTGKYFFAMPILAVTPTRQSSNAKEKLALFFPPGNTCQATVANNEHLENASVQMYLALLNCDSSAIRDDLLNKLPRNDFMNNRAMDDALEGRVEGEFYDVHHRNSSGDSVYDANWKSKRLNEIKRDVTRVGITDQISLLAPDSLVNTIVDLSMNGFKDTDIWNTSTDDFENKFNNKIANMPVSDYKQRLMVGSFLYYQHWSINDGGKLNTCFGDTSVESLRYILLTKTDHYALSSDGSVYDFGFLPSDDVTKFKELFLLISCNKISVNGQEVDLNNVDSNKLGDNNDPINLKINELINNLKSILQNNSKDTCNYSQLYSDYNILYDTKAKRFAFVHKNNHLDIGDASGFVYTMLMDIIESRCSFYNQCQQYQYQLRYDFFIGQDQINDWIQMPICQNGLIFPGIARLNSKNNRFSFSQHLQQNRGRDKSFYTSLYKEVKEHKDAGKILNFIKNTFKFFDEYSIPPNIKKKLAFNEEEIKKIEESAKNTDYLAYFFKAEHLTAINNIIQKLNVQYTDDEKRKDKNIWLKNYYTELTDFLNKYAIGDVLTEQGKKFFEVLKGTECFSEAEKKITINSFQVTSEINCNFDKQINAIDFSLFNSLLDVKNVNSGSRKDTLLSKIRLYANYFFRNSSQDSFRILMGNIGKLSKDTFLKKYFEYLCKKEMLKLKNAMQAVLPQLVEKTSKEEEEKQKNKFDNLMSQKLIKYDFREHLQNYFARELKQATISNVILDDIAVQDLIQLLNSGNEEIQGLVKQCQTIIDDACALKPGLQQYFDAKQYDQVREIYTKFHPKEFKTFQEKCKKMQRNIQPKAAKNVKKKNQEPKRIFISNDFREAIDDDVTNLLQGFDENLINELVESACGKLGLSTQSDIDDIKRQCISEICASNDFCVKSNFIEIFGKIVKQNNGVVGFDTALRRLTLDYKEIDVKTTKDPDKQKTLYKDMVSFRNNEEFKKLYLAWQFIQWMVYLAQIVVYDTCKNDPMKLVHFEDNKHNLECHLRNGNFDRIVSNKDLNAVDNLIGYLLNDCITEQNKIESITERVKLDLADILELTSESDQSTQYNLWLANKKDRKIKDGILSNDTDTTTNTLYFPVQSILQINSSLYNNFFGSLSGSAMNNIGDINQESTLWFDKEKYRILDIDEFFWECTVRGEKLQTMIKTCRQWDQIKFGSTITKERKKQAQSKDKQHRKPLTLQERRDSFDEFASLLRYNPSNLVSGSLQADKSDSIIFELIRKLYLNYRDNRRLGDFFELIENVFLKKYKCMDINVAAEILGNAGDLDKYADGNVDANSNDPGKKENCPIIFLRKNDSSTNDFELQDGYKFELSIDFIINVVKHIWIPDISHNSSVLDSLFKKINNSRLVFCEEKKNDDKNKRKELILLLYILYAVSRDPEKQKQGFDTVGNYENDDVKIEFYQANSFNQFLQNKGFENLLNLTYQFQTEVKQEEEQKQKYIETQKELERLQKEKKDQQQAEKKEQNKEEQNIDKQVKEKEKEKEKVNEEKQDGNNNNNEQSSLNNGIENKNQNNGNEFDENAGNSQELQNKLNNGFNDKVNNSKQIQEAPEIDEKGEENEANLPIEEQIAKYWMQLINCQNEDIKKILEEYAHKNKLNSLEEAKKVDSVPVLVTNYQDNIATLRNMLGLVEVESVIEQWMGLARDEFKNDENLKKVLKEYADKNEIDSLNKASAYNDYMRDFVLGYDGKNIADLREILGLTKQEEKEYEENNNQDDNSNSQRQRKEVNIGVESDINLNEQDNLDNRYHENNDNNNEKKNSEEKDKVNEEEQDDNDNNIENKKQNNSNGFSGGNDDSKILQNNPGSEQDSNNNHNNDNEQNRNNGNNEQQYINRNERNNSDSPHIEKTNEKKEKEKVELEKKEKEKVELEEKEKEKEKENEERKEMSKTQNNNQSVFGNPKNRQIAEGVALTLFIALSILSRFIFPAWLLYISIVGMLISGGLLGRNIWRSRKTKEEKDMNKIVPHVETKEINNEPEENQETNNQNQDNKTKPNVEIGVDSVNQDKDEHLNE